MTVLNSLKPGLDEKLYERALALELRKRGHQVDVQRQFEVHYEGQLIGILVPDLLVDAEVAHPQFDQHRRSPILSGRPGGTGTGGWRGSRDRRVTPVGR